MQWRKESLLALKGNRSRFTALGKGKLWLVTELRLTGQERQHLADSRHCSPRHNLGSVRSKNDRDEFVSGHIAFSPFKVVPVEGDASRQRLPRPGNKTRL
jgi:hypothetical protein